MAIADSFSGLQSAKLSIADANARNYFNLMSQDERQRLDDAALQAQQANFLADLRQRNLSNSLTQRELSNREKQQQLSNDMAKQYFDLDLRRQKQSENQESPTVIRDREFLFNKTDTMAQRGAFEDLDDVLAFNPHLTPDQAGAFANQSQEFRKTYSDEYDSVANMAEIFNKHRKLELDLADAELENKKWNADAKVAEEVKRLKREKGSLDTFVASARARKDFNEILRPDPVTGMVVPAIPRPSFKRFSQKIQQVVNPEIVPSMGSDVKPITVAPDVNPEAMQSVLRVRANEISRQYPSWTKEQITQHVWRELASNSLPKSAAAAPAVSPVTEMVSPVDVPEASPAAEFFNVRTGDTQVPPSTLPQSVNPVPVAAPSVAVARRAPANLQSSSGGVPLTEGYFYSRAFPKGSQAYEAGKAGRIQKLQEALRLDAMSGGLTPEMRASYQAELKSLLPPTPPMPTAEETPMPDWIRARFFPASPASGSELREVRVPERTLTPEETDMPAWIRAKYFPQPRAEVPQLRSASRSYFRTNP